MDVPTPVITRIARTLVRLVRDGRGVTAVEYGMILGFIAVALIVGITSLGNSTSRMWNTVSDKVIAAH
ncbi:Flp family type IVb pilin [Sphingomonas sp. PB2P19]|uniref:Flp family type IVb pilin n=1 Tax=Sphingomonas rhamnosi TaxID=3096156 RepID=UPI002FC6C65F